MRLFEAMALWSGVCDGKFGCNEGLKVLRVLGCAQSFRQPTRPHAQTHTRPLFCRTMPSHAAHTPHALLARPPGCRTQTR
eukprot:360795-Chlamydomonas_euryale.AAC.2